AGASAAAERALGASRALVEPRVHRALDQGLLHSLLVPGNTHFSEKRPIVILQLVDLGFPFVGFGTHFIPGAVEAAACMPSEHFGQLAWQFKRMSCSCGLKVHSILTPAAPPATNLSSWVPSRGCTHIR